MAGSGSGSRSPSKWKAGPGSASKPCRSTTLIWLIWLEDVPTWQHVLAAAASHDPTRPSHSCPLTHSRADPLKIKNITITCDVIRKLFFRTYFAGPIRSGFLLSVDSCQNPGQIFLDICGNYGKCAKINVCIISNIYLSLILDSSKVLISHPIGES